MSKKIRDGTGLIISFSNRKERDFIPSFFKKASAIAGAQKKLIAKGVPFIALSSWKNFKSNEEAINKIVSLKKFGKGRVAILNVGGRSRNTFFVPPPPNKPEIKLWEVDYYFSLAAKAVLWAAGKMPESDLEFLIKDGIAEIKMSGIKKPANLIFRVRNDLGDILYEEKSSRRKIFTLPELPAGGYIADVILQRKGKFLNWHSTSFKIKREPIIQSIEVSSKTIETASKLIFTTMLSDKTKKELHLQIKLTDTLGRLVGNIDEKIFLDQNKVKTEFVLKSPLSNLIKVNAALYERDQKLSHFENYIPVKLPYPRDDFGFIAWNLDSSAYLWHYARKELYKLGLDASYGGRSWMEAWVNATGGFYTIPYMTRYAISRTTKGPYHERIPCLSDPEYIKKEQEKLKKITKGMSPFSPAAYSLGDENDLSLNDHEVCFSKSCKEGFRKYVKNIYKNLDALNIEWDTFYNSWEEIEPIPLEEARELNQPARWVDFRMHMENVFLSRVCL